MYRRQRQQPRESGALVLMVIALVAAGGIGFYALSVRRDGDRNVEPRKEFSSSDLRSREAEYQAKRSEKEAEAEQKYQDDRAAEFKKQEYLERAQRLNPNATK